MSSSNAQAHPNIAFIKYWGNKNHDLRIPTNGSISMNLDGLHTRTQVTFDPSLPGDTLIVNDQPVEDAALRRVSVLLSRVRELSVCEDHASVISRNNFPTGTGIASSAAAFAALSLAASTAAGLQLSEPELSALARSGSGSASRSIPTGFVEWLPGTTHEDSFAISLAPPEHWDLTDCVAVVSKAHKATGSTQGHALAGSSPLQAARIADAPRRLDRCRQALLARDFEAFAAITELDSNLMHAVMQTSTPLLLYYEPATVAIMQSVQTWRNQGLPVCYTIDAGPNVHVICEAGVQETIAGKLREIPGVKEVLIAQAGGPARLVDES